MTEPIDLYLKFYLWLIAGVTMAMGIFLCSRRSYVVRSRILLAVTASYFLPSAIIPWLLLFGTYTEGVRFRLWPLMPLLSLCMLAFFVVIMRIMAEQFGTFTILNVERQAAYNAFAETLSAMGLSTKGDGSILRVPKIGLTFDLLFSPSLSTCVVHLTNSSNYSFDMNRLLSELRRNLRDGEFSRKPIGGILLVAAAGFFMLMQLVLAGCS